jgi:hypothetical protein
MTRRGFSAAQLAQMGAGPNTTLSPPGFLTPTKQPPGAIAIEGQLVTFVQDAAGKLINAHYTLARGEGRDVKLWEVTIAPVFRTAVGSDVLGMPTVATSPNGIPRMRLTWGGGGVKFRDEAFLPAAGASFTLVGDNVMVEVAPTDFATVYTAATRLSMVGWVKPVVSPSASVLFATSPNRASPITRDIVRAFSRHVWISGSNAGATFVVTFEGGPGPITETVALPAGVSRIPVPEWAQNISVTASAGTINLSWEFSY